MRDRGSALGQQLDQDHVARWRALVALGLLVGPAGAGAAELSFEKHVISTASNPREVFAEDLDGDGDTDLLLASWSTEALKWYENDGGSPPQFTEWTIPTIFPFPDADSVFATDLDGDGDADVLAAFIFDDAIAWYENDGGSPPAFTERIISTAADEAASVFAADVDGDGDTDALSVSNDDDKLAWYENDGGSPPLFSERLISNTANRSVYAADLDGDGDIDVLTGSSSGGPIQWFENDGGTPPTFSQRFVSTMPADYRSVVASDLDGDGDTDVLSVILSPGTVVWYENDGGSPPVFAERIISTTPERADTVFAADVDGDGDTDVLSANSQGLANDAIYWYENDGGSPPLFTERIVAAEPGKLPVWVIAADVDGDGDTDVVAALGGAGDTLAWYENGAGIPCADVATFEARCELPGPALDVDVTLTNTSHDGETVTLDVDGTHHTLTIIGDLASYHELGSAEGLHTVTLVDPPGCFAPIVVECPPPINTGGHGRIMVEGECTLVDAMVAANTDTAAGGCTAGSGRDHLVLTEDVLLTEVASSNEEGDNGTPIVISEIQIEGNDFVIERVDGSPQFRIFLVADNGSLGLDSVTVRGGGHGSQTGGIKNLGTLVLTNTTVSENNQSAAAGGIVNYGQAILRDSLVTGNEGRVGGVGNYGGTLTLLNSSVSGNSGAYHGGLRNCNEVGPGQDCDSIDGTVYISASSIAHNDGYYGTAGVLNGGTMFITDSTVEGNTGGIGAPGVFNSGYLHLSGSTISDSSNEASAVESVGAGNIVMVNSTVSGNENFAFNYPSGLDISSYGYLKNVTIADSVGNPAMAIGAHPVLLKNVIVGHTIGEDNCAGMSGAIDLGGNLSDDDSCPPFFGELTGLDPMLADNGGPTETHALLPGSSAIDAGGACGLAPDQRGFLRDALCNSGAFQLDAAAAVGGLVTGLDGRRAGCFNLTTGQIVDIPLDGATTWNCSAAGLVMNPGDELVQSAHGEAGASPDIGGSTAGQQVDEVVCSNLTTGETVHLEPLGPAWSCTAEGLAANPGDLITQRVRGPVP